MRRTRTLFAGGLAMLAATTAPAAAQDDGSFYKGKRLTYIVATNPGGGYDTYARLIARHMAKYLPVSRIIVKNVPGAGHMIGANHVYASKPDGLTIGTFNTGLIYAQLIGQKGVLFDLNRMTWIGKASADPRAFLASAKSGLRTFEDLRRPGAPIRAATSGVGSASYNETTLISQAFRLNVKIITGYRGNQPELAMLRGEIHGHFGSRSSLDDFVRNGNGRFLFQIGGDDADTPQMAALAKTAAARSVVALIASQTSLGRLTAGPPGISRARRDALIGAYRKALTDPLLLADAKKLDIPIVPAFGDDVAGQVRAALNQSPELIGRVAALMHVKAPTLTVETRLLQVRKKGRLVRFAGGDGKTVEAKTSGSRTRITIAGKKSKRSRLAAGMSCRITYAPGGENEPTLMDCR